MLANPPWPPAPDTTATTLDALSRSDIERVTALLATAVAEGRADAGHCPPENPAGFARVYAVLTAHLTARPRDMVGRYAPIRSGFSRCGWARDGPGSKTRGARMPLSDSDRATRRLVAPLPAAERRVLRLRLLDQLTTRAAARRLGLTEAEVRRLQAAGLQQLRRPAVGSVTPRGRAR